MVSLEVWSGLGTVFILIIMRINILIIKMNEFHSGISICVCIQHASIMLVLRVLGLSRPSHTSLSQA